MHVSERLPEDSAVIQLSVSTDGFPNGDSPQLPQETISIYSLSKDKPVIWLRNDCDIILREVDRLNEAIDMTNFLNRALYHSILALNGSYRKCSGEPYIVHPIDTAIRVAGVTNDQVAIAAALRHDDVEQSERDTEGEKIVTIKSIQEQSGLEVATLVDVLTPPEDVAKEYEEHKEDETERLIYGLNKKYAALSRVVSHPDPRGVLVKSGDVLSNINAFLTDRKRMNPLTSKPYGNDVFKPFKMPQVFTLERLKVFTIALIKSYRNKAGEENPFARQLLDRCFELIYQSSLNSNYEDMYAHYLGELEEEMRSLQAA